MCNQMAETSPAEQAGSFFSEGGTHCRARIALRGAKRVEPPVQDSSWKAQRARRINLEDLKGRLSDVLGPKKDKEYCALFSSFLSRRLSKTELDKRLLETLGRDNIRLHNEIVKAIFRNATCGEGPPPLAHQGSRRRKAAAEVEVHTRSPTSPLQVSSTPKRAEDEEAAGEALAKRVRLNECVPLCVKTRRGSSSGVAVMRGEEEEEEEEERLGANQLPDSEAMQRRMEGIAIRKSGLAGVHSECANLLNHGVDAHLKRLIAACLELAQARRPSGVDPISIIDLKLAVELNTRQLGEDWPVQLERISLRAFDHHLHPG